MNLTAPAQADTLPIIVMTKWCTTIVLLAAMTGGTLAGVPTHSGEHNCPMSRMSDCCEKARMKGDAPQVSTARLCCALNCTEPGTTGHSGTINVTPPVAPAVNHAAVPASWDVARSKPQRGHPAPGHLQHSSPAYIRHLSLLI